MCCCFANYIYLYHIRQTVKIPISLLVLINQQFMDPKMIHDSKPSNTLTLLFYHTLTFSVNLTLAKGKKKKVEIVKSETEIISKLV